MEGKGDKFHGQKKNDAFMQEELQNDGRGACADGMSTADLQEEYQVER